MLRRLIVFMLVSLSAVPIVAQTDDANADATADTIIQVTNSAAESAEQVIAELLEALRTIPPTPEAQLVLIAGGTLLLLVGWRIYNFIIMLSGAFIGSAIAVSLVAAESALVNIAAMLVGAFVGAFVASLLYFAAVFIIGAYIGIVLTTEIAIALSLTPISPWLVLGAALVGGILMLLLSFEFLILLSSIVGAQLLTLGLGLSAVWTVALIVIGVVVQAALARSFGYSVRRAPDTRGLLGRG